MNAVIYTRFDSFPFFILVKTLCVTDPGRFKFPPINLCCRTGRGKKIFFFLVHFPPQFYMFFDLDSAAIDFTSPTTTCTVAEFFSLNNYNIVNCVAPRDYNTSSMRNNCTPSLYGLYSCRLPSAVRTHRCTVINQPARVVKHCNIIDGIIHNCTPTAGCCRFSVVGEKTNSARDEFSTGIIIYLYTAITSQPTTNTDDGEPK